MHSVLHFMQSKRKIWLRLNKLNLDPSGCAV